MTHLLGSTDLPLRVAVVGSGPSGFYAIAALFTVTSFTLALLGGERGASVVREPAPATAPAPGAPTAPAAPATPAPPAGAPVQTPPTLSAAPGATPGQK